MNLYFSLIQLHLPLTVYYMLRSKYLRQFKEEDYKVVFKSSLEGELQTVKKIR